MSPHIDDINNIYYISYIYFLLLFQVVMSPHDPPPAFVESYLKLLQDSDIGEFQKTLDMKVREGGDSTPPPPEGEDNN